MAGYFDGLSRDFYNIGPIFEILNFILISLLKLFLMVFEKFRSIHRYR